MMKILDIILIVFILFSCKHNQENIETNLNYQESENLKENSLVEGKHIEKKVQKKRQEIDSLRNPNHNAYLTDLSFTKIGELVLKDSVQPTDNHVTFQLLDTISKCNENDISFYLKVFDKIMLNADGALAEAVGVYALNFIKKKPKVFISHIDTIALEQVDDWASYTAFEMYFDYEEDVLLEHCQLFVDNLKEISINENLLRFEKKMIASAKSLIKD